MSHQQYSYRPNMARNVTRKWAEARQVNYGGDDWGDDPYGSYDEPVQQPLSYDRRAQTNPPAFNSMSRTSFDPDEERRHFQNTSSTAGFPAFDNAQPMMGTSQRDQSSFAPPSRQQTMPAHMQHPSREVDPFANQSLNTFHKDNARPDTRSSDAASGPFPPRKTSLGQSDLLSRTEPGATTSAVPSALASKPLPFVRPADIYKRMDEEKEKERRSQDSSRPSMDSIQRDNTSTTTNVLQPTVFDPDAPRKKQTTLDTVPERKSEYGLENKIDTAPLQAAGTSPFRPTDTSALQRNQRSTFEPESAPILPPKDNPPTSSSVSKNLQHQPSLGYKTMVQDAFETDNQNRDSPAMSHNSVLRSNTASTSEISPIVERARDQPWKQPLTQISSTKEGSEDDFAAPRRLGTARRNSPSPARQPLSVVSRDVAEPHSAFPMEDSINTPITKDTATQAQLMRPGPAILIHQQPRSKEYIHTQDNSSSQNLGLPLRKQESQASGSSEQRSASEEWQEWSAARRDFNAKHGIKDSNPTSPGPESINTSNRDLSDGQSKMAQEARSQDMDVPVIPTTTNMLASFQPHSSQDDGPIIPTTTNSIPSSQPYMSRDHGAIIPTTTNLMPSSRPDMSRDESFRPSLPGGWQSSTDVRQTAEPMASVLSPSTNASNPTTSTASRGLASQPLTKEMARTESLESVPTATAPKRDNWRSDYTGPQAQAFANVRTAGTALTGVFPATHSTSTATADSEVSSINEHDEGPTGKNRDTASAARDFAASPPSQSMTTPKHSSAREFVAAAVVGSEASKLTSRGRSADKHDSAFGAHTGESQDTLSALPGRVPSLRKDGQNVVRDESPSKASDRWWSDDEDAHPTTDVPAPLRTSRIAEAKGHASRSLTHTDSDDEANHDQLEADIVSGLTPKSSRNHPSVESERPVQNDRIGQSNNAQSRSPPFAAAALALSPSGGRKSIDEQTSRFQPSQTLESHKGKESDPHATEKATMLAASGVLVAGAMGHQHKQHQHPSNTTSHSKPLPAQPIVTQDLPTDTSATQKSQSPALARLNSAAKKEFTITHEPIVSPTSAHSQTTHGELLQQAASHPENSPVAKHLTGGTVNKQYPARASANAAATLPSPTNKGSDLAPVHEHAIERALEESVPAAVTANTPVHTDDRRGINIPAATSKPSHEIPTSGINTTAATSGPSHEVARSGMNTPAAAVRPSHESPTSATVASESTLRPSTPTSKIAGVTSASTPTSKAGAQQSASTSTGLVPEAASIAALSYPYDPDTAFPSDKVPSSQIVGMGTAQQRIKAYNDNRNTYIQPVGHLESWLSTMNTPEHADVFAGQHPTTNNIAPSPRASSGRDYGGPSGSRQMQDDGRRLLEGAKKYGGKASFLGKGLLSKGKEKLRTASASNKGSRNTSAASGPSQHSSASGSAPQLPPPSTTTPIGEDMVSDFFASRQDVTEQNRGHEPFTPISEVSTRETSNLDHKSVGGIHHDQTSRAQRVGKSGILLPTPVTADAMDKRKSAAATSAFGPEQDGGRYSSDRLNPSVEDERRNSSVSDVSSVSDTHMRRQSLAARTVSPPIERQTTRNIPPYSAMAVPAAAAAMPLTSAAKEAEAEKDRAEESTLPRYTQTSAQEPKIAPGTQIVPIGRLGNDQTEREEQQRPFSFVGNDSLLHAGGDRQHTIDSPDSTLRNTNRHSNIAAVNANQSTSAAALSGAPSNVDRTQAENPLPSARRPPEEMAKLRQNAAPFVSQEEEPGYRIPGPYTRELRSPKPKTHSPVKEQSHDEYPRASSPVRDAAAAAAVGGGIGGALGAARSDHATHAHAQRSDHQQQYEPEHQQRYLQQQMDSSGPVSRPGKDRSRKNSKLGGFFSTRPRSPTKHQQEDRSRLEPENKRNSLFKLGSRTSISSRGDSELYDELHGQKQRPVATGPRRLSKEQFKSTAYNQHQPGHANYNSTQGPLSAPPTKKKRFSGFFSKNSREQVPTRASTLPFPMDPSQAQGQYYNNQNPAEQQRYSTIGAEQPFQAPHEGYYGQREGDNRQSRLYDSPNDQIGQMAQQHEYNHPQSSNQRQYNDPISDQRREHHSTANASTALASTALATAALRSQDGAHMSGPAGQQAPGSYQYGQQQQGGYNQYTSDQRPDLRLNTGERQTGFAPASAPPVPHDYTQSRQRSSNQTTPLTAIPGYQQAQSQVPQTHVNKDISYGSGFRSTDTPTNQFHPSMVTSPTSTVTPRVQALHMRSRSPKLGRPTSEDLTEEINALASSTTGDLGTFSNKNVSPAGGIARSPEEQEKPWTIGIPGEDDPADRARTDEAANLRSREIRRLMMEKASANNGNTGVGNESTSGSNRPQTVAERFMGHGMPAPKASGKGPQTPTSTSTSTTAGKVPSPKTSLSSFSINRNPSLRGKGAALSRSTTPVASNADLARTSMEQANTTPHAGTNAPRSAGTGIPPMPTSRAADHLGTSKTGERNENYPASAIALLASQNRANADRNQDHPPLSVSTQPKESTSTGAAKSGQNTAQIRPVSSGIPAGMLPDNRNRGISGDANPTSESAYEARSSLANAPTPPPTEPKRRPPTTSKSVEIHELVGSRPEGYESDDEPEMSATAYPGQEWQPVFDIDD